MTTTRTRDADGRCRGCDAPSPEHPCADWCEFARQRGGAAVALLLASLTAVALVLLVVAPVLARLADTAAQVTP